MQSLRLPPLLLRAHQIPARTIHPRLRTLTSTVQPRQAQTTAPSPAEPERPVNWYKAHGRAFAKVLTLAFLTYQISYWTWLLLETEEIKDQKNREISGLEQEVRLLDEGRKGHRPGGG